MYANNTNDDLRRSIKERIKADTAAGDVVDRAMELVKNEYATIYDINRAIEYAIRARPDRPWIVFKGWVRKIEDNHVNDIREDDQQSDEDPEVLVCYRDKEGRNMAIPTTALNRREAEALSEELSGKRLTYREALAEINAYQKKHHVTFQGF